MDDKSQNNGPAIAEKFVIRLPAGLREQIRQISEANRRSMNSEIITIIEEHLGSLRLNEMLAAKPDENAGLVPVKRQGDLQAKLQALPADKKEALLKLLL